MITTLLFDFSRVLLLPADDNYLGTLKGLYKQVSQNNNYEFEQYFKLNEELLEFLDKVRNKYLLAIFTSGTIQNILEVGKRISPIFKKIYSAEELGIKKNDPKAYLLIANKLNRNTNNILYIDDQIKNIAIAQSAGLTTVHFQSTIKLFKQLDLIGINLK